LKQAHDAIILDNSEMTPDQQLAQALEWANQRIAG
jgi:cytidylate kinase